MTKEQFDNLKVGDVLRWRRAGGTYILRTIIDRGRTSVCFPIRRKSWTRRMHTCYGYHDVATRCELHDVREEQRMMTDGELLQLCEAGFDIPKALHRERGQFGCLNAVPVHKMAGAAMLARAFCQFTKTP